MGAQPARLITLDQTGAPLQGVKQLGHAARIEARTDEKLEAHAVGFFLVLAGEVDLALHLPGGHARDRGAGHLAIAGAGGHDRRQQPRQRGDLVARLGLHLARHVVLGDVGDFVGEHRGKFGFVVGCEDQAGIHADIAAR